MSFIKLGNVHKCTGYVCLAKIPTQHILGYLQLNCKPSCAKGYAMALITRSAKQLAAKVAWQNWMWACSRSH